ncbi:MAG: MFS transporter [Thermomicrobiales bacterium]
MFRFPFFRNKRDGRRSALWQNANFINLWSAESVSQFGTQISLLAIPLIAALNLDASPLEMGILGAAGGLPRFIFGFLIGPWVDRHNKRRIMLVTDIGRTITLLAIPFAWWLDVLTIPLLLLVAVAVGIQSVLFNTAYSAIVPVIVERRQLGDAHSKLWASVSLAQAVGPAVAGGLVSIMSAPFVTIINAATYLWSGFFIRKVDADESELKEDTTTHRWRHEIMDGFRVLVASPIMRATTTTSVLVSLTGNMFLSVYVLYMANDLNLTSSGIGLVYAAGGVGALLGTMVSGWFVQRLGVGGTIVWGAVACGAFGIAVPAAILVPDYALPLIVVAEFLQWMALTVHDVNRVALRQALTPNRLQGRIAASTQTLYGGAQTAGLLLGGLIAEVIGVQITLVIGIVGMFVATWFVWNSPTRQQRTMPDEPDPHFALMQAS